MATATSFPRSSQETERRHLLNSSTAASETSSIRSTRPPSTSGTITPHAASPASTQRRATVTDIAQPYRGFPSKAAYLEAFNAWAESKKYIEPTQTEVKGFYGETTMEEYASRPGLEVKGLGLRRKWRARKEGKGGEREGQRQGEGARRATVA